MEELYSIMRELLEIEYNQKSLLYVLEVAETAYCEQQEEAKLIINHTKGCLKVFQKDLKAIINRVDCYIAMAAEHK